MFEFQKSSVLLVGFFLAVSQNILETHCVPLEDERLSKLAEVRSYMDVTVDPCTDFYNYSCGNWANIYPTSSAVSQTGSFENIAKALGEKQLRMLKADAEPEDTAIDVKVKDFFKSCINFANKNDKDEYRQQLLAILAEIGGMPALLGSSWNPDNFDWLTTVAQVMHKYNAHIIIKLDIAPDFRNSSVNRIYVSSPDFHLETRSMYVDPQNEVYRKKYKVEIANELNSYLHLEEYLANQVADELVDFEVALARGLVDDNLGLTTGQLSQLTTAAAMTKKYAPTLNVETLMNIAVPEALNDPIFEYAESYQKHLLEVLQKTPKHVVANYISRLMLSDFLFNTTSVPAEQEEYCLQNLKKYFSKNLDNMIYRRYNNKATEDGLNEIWMDLKQTFKRLLESNHITWISEETRQKAIEKLEVMKFVINTHSDEPFDEQFGDVQIRRDDYLGNLKNILKAANRNFFAKLRSPPRSVGEEDSSADVFNSIMENKVKVPVMMLQPKFMWAPSYPKALQFGSLGAIIGHEITHGFDDNGRQYDKHGNQVDWWDEKSSDNFIKRKECFVDQYSRYSYGGQMLPRSESQAENIADGGGTRLAYAAYLHWLEEAMNNQLEALPTMDLNSKQLFFVAYAQIWCTDVDPSLKGRLVATDSHTPRELRAIATPQNMVEFSKAFNCASDSVMNPATKCILY